MTLTFARDYPTTTRLGPDAVDVTLRPMEAADRAAILAFARRLPEHDLLFLRRDITRPQVVDAWLGEIAAGCVGTLLALRAGRVLGYGTLHREALRWMDHIGEIRVVVDQDERGLGLGRILTQEVFATALASGIEKLVARMTVDQKGAIATFEGLGFKPEALLRDHVRDMAGDRHDLLMMSHEVAEFQTTLDSYGVTDALG